MSEQERRAATITGLYALADWLAAHPDVPVPRYDSTILRSVDGDTDAAAMAELDRIAEAASAKAGSAEIVDVDLLVPQRGHPKVSVAFGPVRYELYHVMREEMRRHHAASSYANVVEPESDGW